MWPACRDVSSSMWMRTHRIDTFLPSHDVPVSSSPTSAITVSAAARARP